MSISDENLNHTETSLFFNKISKFLVVAGLPGYIKWRESGYTRAIYKYIHHFLTICILILIVMELGALITQKNFSEKEDMMIYGIAHFIFTSYSFVFLYHKEKIRNLLYKFGIELRNVYNDLEVERQMIKKICIYSVVYILNIMSAMMFISYNGLMQAIHDGTFVTVITAWPDIADKSTLANFGRVIFYLIWWVCMIRYSAVFLLLIIITGCLSYQFKNLQSYFYSLNDIFDEEDVGATDPENAEQKYENALKVGIKLHADTLWCTEQCQVVCSVVYSAHLILNVSFISWNMLMMMSAERTFGTTLVLVFSSIALLSSTGITMWNAGDVTVEASLVPTAMYSSGWQNCRGKSSQRVRKLLVIAMNQSQRPVVLRSFGIIEISYQSYVSMVKACYSAFSLMY